MNNSELIKCKLSMEYLIDYKLVKIRITSPTGKSIGLNVIDKNSTAVRNNICYEIVEKETYKPNLGKTGTALFQKYEISNFTSKDIHDSLEVLETIINFPYLKYIYASYDFDNCYEKNIHGHFYDLDILLTVGQMVTFKHIQDVCPHLSVIS